MREQLQARLIVLKREFETGQMQIQELDRQGTRLRETLLRISGAIQVIEELLNEPEEGNDALPMESHSVIEGKNK